MAYQFTAASSQYLSVGSAPVTAAPLTMACWFNMPDNAGAALIYLGPTTNNDRFALFASGDAAGDPVRFDCIEAAVTAAASAALTTSSYSNNTWSHACGVASSASSRTVYLNGGSSGTNTDTRTPTTPNRLTVGARLATNSPGVYANGLIAEVGIWNAALTAAEIASLAKGMTCDKVRPQSLVFYAPLVRDLIDAKGRLAITNNNGATVANHPRVYA
jgi:hypothetical protein